MLKAKDFRLIKLGQLIKIIRKERNISQERLAELSNMDRSYMGRIERGEKNITFIKILDICGALKISVSEFIIRYADK